jgi:hypothetical protein
MGVQSFRTTKVPILGLSFENFKKNCHLDVTLASQEVAFYF